MKRSILFLVAVVVLSWAFFLVPVVAGPDMGGAALFKLAGTFVPTIAGMVCTLKFRGRDRLRSLLLSALRFRFRPGWFAFVFLFMPLIVAGAAVFLKLTGTEVPKLNYIDPPYGVVLAFFYIFALQGPLGEEFGWRGYALPGLLERVRPLWAGLLVGLFWSAWHLPLFYTAGEVQSGLPFAGYAVFTTVMSLVYTVVWIKTGGDMFYPLVLHTVSNLSHGVLTLIGFPAGQRIFFITFLTGAGLFLIIYRKALLNRISADTGPRIPDTI